MNKIWFLQIAYRNPKSHQSIPPTLFFLAIVLRSPSARSFLRRILLRIQIAVSSAFSFTRSDLLDEFFGEWWKIRSFDEPSQTATKKIRGRCIAHDFVLHDRALTWWCTLYEFWSEYLHIKTTRNKSKDEVYSYIKLQVWDFW